VLRRRWPEVLETVKGLRRVTWALIDPRNAQVAELDATTLRVAFDNPALATTFRNGAHADVVARAVRETLGFDVRVEGILAEQVSAAPAAPAAARPAPDDRANPRAVTPAEAAASWDDEPPMPEPPDDEPGEPATPDGPPQDIAPPPGTARERGMAAARESASRMTPGVPDDPSPDDPDITTSSLIGAPLVAQMLGGTVIDEQLDDGSS
jgi:DNA polymerase-3 subunit gamma/tau